MVRVWEKNFACDECPICEGIEHRLRVAEEGGYEPQLEYCGCDKVQTEFFISGYCDDAFQEDVAPAKSHKPRKTGRAYRRQMRKQKKDKLMKIMTYGYNPAAGYTDWDWVNGVFQPVGNHIQYPRSSNRQVYWKNQSNRKVRRYKGSIPKGNSYRKHFEYVYTIF